MRIGAELAEARARAGLTVAEVSRRTRIREVIIRGIEADDYSACGGDFYARGNIRNIANAVGTDPEPLICEYDVTHGTGGEGSAAGLDELLSPAQPPRRHRLNWAAVLAVALVVAAGFVGYELLTSSPRTAGTPPAAAHHTVTPSATPAEPTPSRVASPHPTAPARAPLRPAAIVRAYIAAINGHHYARAWRLGGRNTGDSYGSFAEGFSGTARDTLSIVSVSGNVVTARLRAQQTDGTVSVYEGTYTVQHGVITGFDVAQVG
ncbi:MAG TPA: helix-turn-helix domain-containing protein [Streptosporangiaceae bacterium]